MAWIRTTDTKTKQLNQNQNQNTKRKMERAMTHEMNAPTLGYSPALLAETELALKLADRVMAAGQVADEDLVVNVINDTPCHGADVTSLALRICQHIGIDAGWAITKTCKACGDAFVTNDEGAEICTFCADDMVKCEECGEYVNKNDATEINGDRYCESCRDDNYIGCESCGEWIALGDDIEVRVSIIRGAAVTEQWCEDCVGQHTTACDHCDATVADTLRTTTVDGEEWCQRCTDRSAHYCDHCEVYHSDDYECYECSESDECQDTWDCDDADYGDDDSYRFLGRLIGVELETGENGTAHSFMDAWRYEMDGWGYTDDSSLTGGGVELVSPKMRGRAIGDGIEMAYLVMKAHGVVTEHNKAGAHVHVDIRDFIERQKMRYDHVVRAHSGRFNRADEYFLRWGRLMAEICTFFVSTSRASNHYCSDGFALRGTATAHQRVSKKITSGRYPTIALRSETLEFRIWPSTSCSANMLSRVELSQKAVDRMVRFIEKPKRMRNLLCGLSKALRLLKASKGNAATEKIGALLSLTDETVDTLKRLGSKHRPEIFVEGV